MLLKKHNIDYEKVKDLDNPSLGGSLGPTLDPRVELEEELELVLVLEEELKEKETLKEKVKVKKEKAIILPINTEAFSNARKAWTDYKEAQFKFTYKTDSTEQIALKELAEKAENMNKRLSVSGDARGAREVLRVMNYELGVVKIWMDWIRGLGDYRISNDTPSYKLPTSNFHFPRYLLT